MNRRSDLNTAVAGDGRSENGTKLRTILDNLNRDAKASTRNTGVSDAKVRRKRLTGGLIVVIILGFVIVVIVFSKP